MAPSGGAIGGIMGGLFGFVNLGAFCPLIAFRHLASVAAKLGPGIFGREGCAALRTYHRP